MLKIRLKRIGKRKQAFYRVVVMESTIKRDGLVVADLGAYNPHVEDSMNIDTDAAKAWLVKGAQPTETVAQFFVKMKVMTASKKKGSVPAKGRTKKKEAKA